jgi:peptidoglycan/LPS O-acetylase OafA/YrhL
LLTLENRLVANSFKGPGFDQLRLLAATVVLIYHSRGVSIADIRLDPLFFYSKGFMQFGLLAVLVFFAISGFLVTPGLVRSGNVIEYMTNRILRIFPALVMVVLTTMLLLGPTLTNLSIKSYFSDPGFYLYAKNITTWTYNFLPGVLKGQQPVIVNGALWTLHYEVLSYVALAIISIVGILRWRTAFLVLFALVYAAYVLTCLSPAIADMLGSRYTTFIGLFVYFAAGATLYLFRDLIPYSMAVAISALALILAGLPFGAGPLILPVCLPYITVVCGLSVLPGRSLFRRDVSYGVYLTHAPILVAIAALAPNTLWWLAAIITFLISAALSYLSSRFVERPVLDKKKVVAAWLNQRVNMIVTFGPARGRATIDKPKII